jgi:hypothetical protein
MKQNIYKFMKPCVDLMKSEIELIDLSSKCIYCLQNTINEDQVCNDCLENDILAYNAKLQKETDFRDMLIELKRTVKPIPAFIPCTFREKCENFCYYGEGYCAKHGFPLSINLLIRVKKSPLPFIESEGVCKVKNCFNLSKLKKKKQYCQRHLLFSLTDSQRWVLWRIFTTTENSKKIFERFNYYELKFHGEYSDNYSDGTIYKALQNLEKLGILKSFGGDKLIYGPNRRRLNHCFYISEFWFHFIRYLKILNYKEYKLVLE